MPSKTVRVLLVIVVALILITGAFSGGVIVGWMLPGSPQASLGLPIGQASGLNQPSGSGSATPTNLRTLFKPFWQTWQIVHDQYVDQPVNDLNLMRGAIRGMLQALDDPHTSYMDPDQFRQASTSLQGEYEGIGAWVDITGDYLSIISPMPGSPAEKAGLKAGDKVIKVDGEDMTGIDGNLVLKHILGPAGTKVKLTIQREGQDLFDVEIERAKIVVPSVQGEMLSDNIAYVHIVTFGDNTTEELKKVLSDLMSKQPKGLIVDLRNNAGGYLPTAIEVVSQFIKGGQVAMYEQFGDGTRKTYTTLDGGLATEIPLVVLVNKGTASASEITAGTIQDYGRGKLVGEVTYGKGSVQNWIALENNQGAVRVTIARWLTPKERAINKVGLTPDVEVKITDEDIKAGNDPQLEKAIELLSTP